MAVIKRDYLIWVYQFENLNTTLDKKLMSYEVTS